MTPRRWENIGSGMETDVYRSSREGKYSKYVVKTYDTGMTPFSLETAPAFEHVYRSLRRRFEPYILPQRFLYSTQLSSGLALVQKHVDIRATLHDLDKPLPEKVRQQLADFVERVKVLFDAVLIQFADEVLPDISNFDNLAFDADYNLYYLDTGEVNGDPIYDHAESLLYINDLCILERMLGRSLSALRKDPYYRRHFEEILDTYELTDSAFDEIAASDEKSDVFLKSLSETILVEFS